MDLNKNKPIYSHHKFIKNEKFIQIVNVPNLNYLYPNGHRMTHQMRWFKGTRDIDSKSDLAA